MVNFSCRGEIAMARFFKDDFWGRVDQRMLDLGLTLKQVCRWADLSYSTTANQKSRGMVPPKHETIESLSNALGCSPAYLLYGEDKESNTLSEEMMELLSRFKMLEEKQKKVVSDVIDQFIEDNRRYAEVYVELHPVSD